MEKRITQREAETERKNSQAFDVFLSILEKGKSQTEALDQLKMPGSTLRTWIAKDPDRIMLQENAKAIGRLAKLAPLQAMAEDRAMEVLKHMDTVAPTPAQMGLITALLKSRHVELRDGPQVAVGVKVESDRPEEKVITLEAAGREVKANGASD